MTIDPRDETKGDDASADVSFIKQANDARNVRTLSNEIGISGTAWAEDDDDSRLGLLKKARALVQALETPRETMIKHLWAQPTAASCLACGVESGLFKLMSQRNAPKKVTELATVLGVDSVLLGRQLRHIAAMGYVKEIGEDEYEATNFAKSLAVPIIGDGYPCNLGACFPVYGHLPKYFIQNDWQEPKGPPPGPFQKAWKTDMNMLEFVQANPPWATYLNHHFGGCRQGHPSWMDPGFYPVQDRLIDGLKTDEDATLLVDVGGNIGHDIDEFRRKHPDAPGRLVLQDLPRVLDTIKQLDSKIERMAYDFHTEQPIKGARAYYMHCILHDWPDEVCDSILSRVTATMEKGYSKLLIHENVIPRRHADWQATSLDLVMMGLYAAKERTEAAWQELLPRHGLRIVKIWSKGEGVESIIESELA